MRYTTFSVCLSAVLLIAVSVNAADWPHWRGPDYDGISKETTFNASALHEPKILWEAEVGVGYSAVSVADGRAYTMGNVNKNTDVVFCFDAVTGKELWKFEYPEDLDPKYYEGGCSATPTVNEGKVYTISKTGKVFCLEAGTGKLVWQKTLDFKKPTWGFAGSALILEDKCIVNVGASGVALDRNTGDILWQSKNTESGYATPVPFEHNGSTLIAIFAKDTIMAVNPADGNVAWSFPWKTQHDVNAADPIIWNRQVFITSGYGRGAALIDISGDQPVKLWENKSMESQMSGPVLIDGFLYGIDDNQLACVDWKTGDQKWVEKAPKKGAVAAVGDKVLVMHEGGTLSIAQASPEGYKELAAAKITQGKCWTMPIVANGRIYVRDMVRNKPGTLFCIDMNE
jgi:outer membrane protein assembly factor BamB